MRKMYAIFTFVESKKSITFAPLKFTGWIEHSILSCARMAESVDALVSNTSGRKAVPVRPRLRVQTPIVCVWIVGVLLKTNLFL